MVLSFSDKKMLQKAFTLMELLVVIAVTGLLSSIIFVIVSGSGEQGRIAKGLYFSQHLHNSLGSYTAGTWNFDEGSGTTASDISGWENDGTLVNFPVWRCASVNTDYTPSGQGCSLEFNGINNYVSLGDGQKVFVYDDNPFTFSAWINFKGMGSQTYQRIVTLNSNKTSAWSLGVSAQTNYNGLYFGSTNDFITRKTDFTPPLNKWGFVVVTYNGLGPLNASNFDIYYNAEKIQTSAAGAFGASTQVSMIGSRDSAAYFFNGLIDEVRLYNMSLSLTQTKYQYLAGLDKLLTEGQISKQEHGQYLAEVWGRE